VPPGTRPVDPDVEGLLPTLEKNDELWLFRVPSDFSVTSLKGCTLSVPTSKDSVTNIKVERKSFSLSAGGTDAESMEASQVVGMFPSSVGLRISGPFRKHFILTQNEHAEKPTDPVAHIPTKACIVQHPNLRPRFRMMGSEAQIPKFAAQPFLSTPGNEKPQKKSKKSDKKDKGEKRKSDKKGGKEKKLKTSVT